MFSFDGPHLSRLVNFGGSVRPWAGCAIETFPSPYDTPDVSVVRLDKYMHVTAGIGRRDHHDDIGSLLLAPVVPDEVARFPIGRLAARSAATEALVANNMAAE